MRVLVTGSAGHLGEALVRTLRAQGVDVVGVDLLPSPYTTHVGSITDREFVRRFLSGGGIHTVMHTGSLHKPHVATHSRQMFVDVNITGTLNLLEEALAAHVQAFVFTSTTSLYGDALEPDSPCAPAVWVDEALVPRVKNVYGSTKAAAEDLCQMFARNHGLRCVVLRVSRFFSEEDDDEEVRAQYTDDNTKVNEYLFSRVEIEDAVRAHLLAAHHARRLRFARFVISATTPFSRTDLQQLNEDAPAVLRRLVPEFAEEYARRGWRMLPRISKVYVNEHARRELGWQPRYDFRYVLERLSKNLPLRSEMQTLVGVKGYHRANPIATSSCKGPYPVEPRVPSYGDLTVLMKDAPKDATHDRC